MVHTPADIIFREDSSDHDGTRVLIDHRNEWKIVVVAKENAASIFWPSLTPAETVLRDHATNRLL